MERLERHLRTALERASPAGRDLVEIVRAWPAAVGEQLARNAWPARLQQDGTLVVHAVSATWAFELGRMAPEILERLRTEAGDAGPAGLRFVPGPVPEPPAAAPARPAAEHLPPDARDLAEAARAAALVEDEGLRDLVARTVAASLARSRREGRSDQCF